MRHVDTKLTIYLPAELAAWLSDLAAEQRRSVSSQALFILEQARPVSQRPSPSGRTASRLPEDFGVSPEMAQWARANVPALIAAGRGAAETEKFKDYWRSAGGPASRKRDWVAAWRYWMRRADEGAGHRSAPARVQQETDGLFDRAMERARTRSAQEAGDDPRANGHARPLHQGALPPAAD